MLLTMILLLLTVILGLLTILFFLVLTALACGLCRLCSEETQKIPEGDSEKTEDTADLEEDAHSTHSYWDGTKAEEENESNFPFLSAGGAFVLGDENFPPLHPESSSGPLVSYISPRKVVSPLFHGRAQLNEAAKFKHIDPKCKTVEDAEKKSEKRNSRYPQEIGEHNTVFQVSPEDFTVDNNETYGKVLKSKEAVRNWNCRKISSSKYEGAEESRMNAVFTMPEEDCHYSPKESRKTRMSGGSVPLADLISTSRSSSRSRSRSTGRKRSCIQNPNCRCQSCCQGLMALRFKMHEKNERMKNCLLNSSQ